MARRRPGPRRGPRREKRNIPRGQAHIQATFNNTIITLTDPHGNTVAWASAAQQAARGAQDNGMREVDVFVKGPGPGREAAIRALQAAGITVRSITDVTPIPHNGCRPPKKRRV